MIDNKAQVLVGKHKNGTARLEIYFTDGNVAYFAFNAITRMEATKWAGAIARLVLNEKENGYDPSAYAVPGAEKLAETIKGTMDTFKTVFNKKCIFSEENPVQLVKRTGNSLVRTILRETGGVRLTFWT